MMFARPSKQIYIRLVENEPALVYTVRYAGLFWRSGRVPLGAMTEVLSVFGDQVSRIVRWPWILRQ
jgi:hypothetical protein